MCSAWKIWIQLHANQFVEVLSHLSFLITICRPLYRRFQRQICHRGGVTSKRFNRHCPHWHLEVAHIWLNCRTNRTIGKRLVPLIPCIWWSADEVGLQQIGFYRASIILETDDLGIVTHFCVIPGQRHLDNSSHFLVPLIYNQLTHQQLVEKFGEENNLHHKVP